MDTKCRVQRLSSLDLFDHFYDFGSRYRDIDFREDATGRHTISV